MSNINGCLIISNEAAVSRPADAGAVNAYDVDFEKPNFFVNNHWLTPVKSCYSLQLSNPVSLESGDKLRIKIKVPKQILGQKYGYELEGLESHAMTASLRLKSSDGVRDVDSTDDELVITKEAFCGWFIITLTYHASTDVCNLCNIGYSLCFQPLKLKTLYGVCDGDDNEIVKFDSETCVEICNPATNPSQMT